MIIDRTDFSEWSPWTDCQGVPCQMGHQQRMRSCRKSSQLDCDGEQIEERPCLVSCSSQNLTQGSPPVRPFSKGKHCLTLIIESDQRNNIKKKNN